ncbi:TPA: 50S ribosomal protein L25 [Candidatus Falkowbacteria bacterium]|nr:MAG: 50S ribosomal protein L25 [Candidatus Falkowbacteria bacterium GW2011_GWF2_43_32]HBA36909.1 50S ribosomal protein L25 [Candidatus Falkowbacteria bacterium]
MELKLSAEMRIKQEKLSKDFISAILYGKGLESKMLKVNKIEFDKVFKEAGESNLIDLNTGDGIIKVLVKDIQRDVLKNFVTHIDFYQVNMKEKITTEIPLHFVGESKAVKELGGALIKDISALEVECLPGDLVDHIDVDISVLNTFDDAIRINDINLPAGLTLLLHTNEMVAAVKEPKVEAEPVAEAAAEGAASSAEATEAGAEAKGEDKGEAKKDGGDKK